MTRLPDNENWNRKVWRLSAPIILSNLFVPLPGAVDTAVLGHLDSEAYLGAVAVSAMIFSFIYWGFGFLRMGTTGPAAQAWGAGDRGELWSVLFRGMLLAGGFGLVLMAAQALIAQVAFSLVEASGDVEGLARTYFDVRIWGAPAALANYVFIGWFLGLQNARIPMILQLFVNGVNVVLDLAFVLGLGMTVDGVALATVIAEYSGLALGIYLVLRRSSLWPADGLKWAQIVDSARLRRMLAVNRDIFIRTLCLVFAFAYFTAQGAKMDDTVLAANMVLMNFVTFTAFGLDGFAHASEALVGDAVGRRNDQSVRQAVSAALKLGGIMAAGVAVVFWFGGGLIVNIFTSIDDVHTVAMDHLIWVTVMPVVSVWCFVFDGVFLGATRSEDLRNGMILSLIGYLILIHGTVPLFGSHGLWLAMTGFMALRGVTLWWRYPNLLRKLVVA